MFVMFVCLGGGSHVTITHDVLDRTISVSPMDMFKLVQLEQVTAPNTPSHTRLPWPQPSGTCSNTYGWQVGSWHPTEILSCCNSFCIFCHT